MSELERTGNAWVGSYYHTSNSINQLASFETAFDVVAKVPYHFALYFLSVTARCTLMGVLFLS